MKGSFVKALQDAMNEGGYDCGEADGIYGEKTMTAVHAFAEAHKDM
ncbi:MAG: peptidoglycan-binding domain-containing protein [Candidatus Pelethousia sp.]|nr:peptidoglycan-binding domain-containing protein [Candidatus Pelethousia sp.]